MSDANWQLCLCGKRGYSSEKRAKRACQGLDGKVGYYACKDSHLWHATTVEKYNGGKYVKNLPRPHAREKRRPTLGPVRSLEECEEIAARMRQG